MLLCIIINIDFFIVKMPPYPLFFCTFTPENQYFIC